jgi:hypothetical protein
MPGGFAGAGVAGKTWAFDFASNFISYLLFAELVHFHTVTQFVCHASRLFKFCNVGL